MGRMRVQDRRVLYLGILCLIGGLLLTYFGYFVYPEYFLAATGQAGPLTWDSLVASLLGGLESRMQP